ncbi:hypothetical protein TNCV_662381 [Trichonephila clavipes]|nr:hypothetical protein TNCV_662381 [Trichonephila clavipes]
MRLSPGATKEPPCRGADANAKGIRKFSAHRAQNELKSALLSMVWCGISEREIPAQCCSRHLTKVQNHEIRRQQPLCCHCGSRVVKVSDCGLSCHEFEPSTTKDLPCRAAMHVKSVES